MPCLAPVLLAGYLLTVQTGWHHTANFDGPMLEVQTCEVGVGLNARVASSGIAALNAQYGWQYVSGLWSWTVQPMIGGSYLDRHIQAVSSQVNFSLGAQMLFGYDHWRLGLGWWHNSNANLGDTNVGLDLITLQTGWSFQ